MHDTPHSLTMTENDVRLNRKRILLVDDHPLMRQAVHEVLESEPDLQVCGETGTVEEALRLIEELQPQVAVIDIALHDGNGIDLVKQVKALAPRLRMVVLSMHDEMHYAERAIRAGAMGYVGKQEPPETIVEAIRQVLSGQVHVSSRMGAYVLSQLPGKGRKAANGTMVTQLSDRELQTFEMIGQGLTTREIAGQLQVSVKTVDAYRQRIKSKLKLKTSNELMRSAVEWSLQQA